MVKDKLYAYKEKRDFGVTQEPRGDAQAASSSRRRFVIQKHAATRLHYDLRLELDGVFKSWAVTRGPLARSRTTSGWRWRSRTIRSTTATSKGRSPRASMAAARCMLWDRGYWAPEGDEDARAGPGEGRTEIHARRRAAARQLGAGADGATTATGGKRTNWLLIKHRDEFAAQTDGAGDPGRTTARSPRAATMAEIAAGKGRAPKPFMTARPERSQADAVWDSRRRPRRRGPQAAGRRPRRAKRQATTAAASCRISFAPQLCRDRSSARPPATGWVHEIKFDGYRMQLRVEGGEATLEDPQGPGLDRKVPGHRARRRQLPDAIIDGEIVRARRARRAGFRRAAGGAVRRQDRRSGLLRLRPAVRRRRGSAPAAAARAQGAAAATPVGAPATTAALRYVEHFETGGDAVLRRPAGCRSKASSRSALDAPYRSGRTETLDQGQVPRRPRGGDRRLGHDRRQVPLAAGRRPSRRHFVYVGRVGTGFGAAKVADARCRG